MSSPTTSERLEAARQHAHDARQTLDQAMEAAAAFLALTDAIDAAKHDSEEK